MKDEMIRRIYTAIGEPYETQIVRYAFQHFAAAVVTTAAPQGHETALDMGTGTGILARKLAPHVKHVTGIDLTPRLIDIGQTIIANSNSTNITLTVGNIHAIPADDHTYDLAVSSFGLNATTPSRSLSEIARVLTPNGILVFHEWNLQHPLDTLLVETLAQYMVDDADAPDDLFALRQAITAPHPWDNVFQTAADYQEELATYGFTNIHVAEDAPAHIQLSVADFLAYKLAWSTRQAELAAMDDYTRPDCMDALWRVFQDQVQSDGMLHYHPQLFRVRATRA